MPDIDNKTVHAAYAEAKQVYEGLEKKAAADKRLVKEHGMNRSSASDYVKRFQEMMAGKVYKRTINIYATDYYLGQILADYGVEKLRFAIHSVNLHIAYYKKKTGANSGETQKIVSRYEEKMRLAEFSHPDELDEDDSKQIFEGAKKHVVVNSYERNPKGRVECIEYYGLRCAVCEFDFEKTYGTVGARYIHVHHLTPISEIGREYTLDPIEDLRPVCPNCHAMLHKNKPPYTLEELREKIKTKG